MNSKQKVLRVLCAAELAVLIGFYFLSPHGLRAVVKMRYDNLRLEEKIANVHDEVTVLEHELEDWRDPFYTEKYAREKLAMGRKNEEIYLIR